MSRLLRFIIVAAFVLALIASYVSGILTALFWAGEVNSRPITAFLVASIVSFLISYGALLGYDRLHSPAQPVRSAAERRQTVILQVLILSAVSCSVASLPPVFKAALRPSTTVWMSAAAGYASLYFNMVAALGVLACIFLLVREFWFPPR
jgi:hypothetical protein